MQKQSRLVFYRYVFTGHEILDLPVCSFFDNLIKLYFKREERLYDNFTFITVPLLTIERPTWKFHSVAKTL